MTVTFKKFVEFVDLETVSEEQIDEIFGVFSNNKKLDKLKAQRDELRAKLNDPKRNAAWDKAKGKADPKKDDEEDPKAIKKPVRTTSNTYPSAASAARHGEREWIASMKESNERIELDDIRRGLKPIMAAISKVDSDASYEAFLYKFGDSADVVDKHISPNDIHSAADRLHYHQKDPDVQQFLRTFLVKNEKHRA